MSSNIVRFERLVVKSWVTGCWLWKGKLDHNGKGHFGVKMPGSSTMRTMLASRAGWLLFCGEIPIGYDVKQTCIVPRCVNPDHRVLVKRPEKRAVKRHSEAHRRKLSAVSRKGDNHPLSKPVMISGIRYPSMQAASKAVGVWPTTMQYWVKKGKAVRCE